MSENDIERLLTGRSPVTGDARHELLAGFVRGVATIVPQPVSKPSQALVARLAAVAAESPRTAPARPRRRRSRTRFIARAGIVAATVPALFAGLAFAGVSLPVPAQDAFEEIGIELPNQATDDEDEGREEAAKGKGSEAGDNGKGQETRRSKRKAYGPSRSARPNPPGEAIRRGPNPSPGTAPGRPDPLPSPSSGGGSGGGGNAGGNSAFGLSQGKGAN